MRSLLEYVDDDGDGRLDFSEILEYAWWHFIFIWVFPKIGVPQYPQNGWFIMENPMNKWMIWGEKHPYFLVQHPYSLLFHIVSLCLDATHVKTHGLSLAACFFRQKGSSRKCALDFVLMLGKTTLRGDPNMAISCNFVAQQFKDGCQQEFYHLLPDENAGTCIVAVCLCLVVC